MQVASAFPDADYDGHRFFLWVELGKEIRVISRKLYRASTARIEFLLSTLASSSAALLPSSNPIEVVLVNGRGYCLLLLLFWAIMSSVQNNKMVSLLVRTN